MDEGRPEGVGDNGRREEDERKSYVGVGSFEGKCKVKTSGGRGVTIVLKLEWR